MSEEPYDGRLSRTVLREAWGETPLVYSTLAGRSTSQSNVNVKTVFSFDAARILPPCNRIICFDRLRPMPVPVFLVVKNGTKISSICSFGIPGPLSQTFTIFFPFSSMPAKNLICSFLSDLSEDALSVDALLS